MNDDLPDNFKEKVDITEKLDLQRRVESEFKVAQTLVRHERYKEALKKFKWVFASDASHSCLVPIELMRKLLKGYPPAATIVKRWRNDKERLVLSQQADSSLIRQWDDLNAALGEKPRTLEVYLKLASASASSELLHDFLNEIWERLARAKKYELLRSFLPTLGFYLLLHATEHDSAVLFPGRRNQSKQQWRCEIKRHVDYIFANGALSYEVALGLGERHVANEFSRKLLGIESSDRVYASLIKGAIRARAFADARALFNEAKQKFSFRQMRHSLRCIRTLPKSQLAMLGLSPLRVRVR